MSVRAGERGESFLVCPNCAREVSPTLFNRWPPDNDLATAVCRGCGRNITVALRQLRQFAA